MIYEAKFFLSCTTKKTYQKGGGRRLCCSHCCSFALWRLVLVPNVFSQKPFPGLFICRSYLLSCDVYGRKSIFTSRLLKELHLKFSSDASDVIQLAKQNVWRTQSVKWPVKMAFCKKTHCLIISPFSSPITSFRYFWSSKSYDL